MMKPCKIVLHLSLETAQWFELRWETLPEKKDKAQYLDWNRNFRQQLLKMVADVLVIHPDLNVRFRAVDPQAFFIAYPITASRL
ncbi:MAG: hypothetical protein IPH78_14925 [Bacteroidetes bacterium]|nr:hypothetical protein [Bacteroidota bacterium]